MATKLRFKIEWIIILALVLMLGGGAIFFIIKINRANKELAAQASKSGLDEKTLLRLKNYEEIEKEYDKALREINESVKSDDVTVEILKKNLLTIIKDIKEKKDAILKNEKRKDTISDDDYQKQLDDMLAMSKEVLAERMAQMQKENANLIKTNKKLKTQNEKLEEKVKKANEFIEEEKAKNVKLNEIITQVNQNIKKLEQQGNTSKTELDQLRKKKDEYEQKLNESNKIIAQQTNQITDLGTILRKVNVECYFIYQQGNPDEQAKIYLTNESVSAKYIKYYNDKKPVLHFDFNINEDLFKDGVEKVDFKLYNSSMVEVFGVSKTISGNKLQIEVTNKNFIPGDYYIILRSGAEDLLIGGKYKFRI